MRRVLLGFILLEDNAYPPTPSSLHKPSEMASLWPNFFTTEVTYNSTLTFLSLTPAFPCYDRANHKRTEPNYGVAKPD